MIASASICLYDRMNPTADYKGQSKKRPGLGMLMPGEA